MNDFGLPEQTLKQVKDILKKYPVVTEARILGSRAYGTYRYNSDVDIVLYGDISYDVVAKIAFELEELPTPYTYDVEAYNTITSMAFKKSIDTGSKILYQSL